MQWTNSITKNTIDLEDVPTFKGGLFTRTPVNAVNNSPLFEPVTRKLGEVEINI